MTCAGFIAWYYCIGLYVVRMWYSYIGRRTYLCKIRKYVYCTHIQGAATH